MFVNTRQARIAGTQTFITAVYCEMLRAYTIRTWDFFLFSFNTNMWMHLGCGISAVSTILVTLIPKVNSIMNLHPIALW
jgi:P-type Ca2+ transporter type 2C